MKIFWFSLYIALFVCISKAFGSEAGMPQLNPQFWSAQIFWLVLIFSALYIVIWKIFLPKITYSIENRKSKIVNDLDESQKLKESAERKLKEYEKIIEDSKKEAKKIFDDNKKKLNENIESKRKNLNEEIEKELKLVENEIKDLRKSSISDINKIAEETSIELVKKIIDININKSNAAAIVNDMVKKKIEKIHGN